MNILIAIDKFKASLSQKEASESIATALQAHNSSLNIQQLPIADGGEGSLQVIENYLNANRIYLEISGPLFKPTRAYYLLKEDTAYIEMAQAAGLQLLEKHEQNCLHTTTLGVGQLIADALIKKVKKIYLLVGGSATNDVGIGMAHALGYRFLDQHKQLLSPIGKHLTHIQYINKDQLIFDKNRCSITVLSDVQNPLIGSRGATAVYAPQKGANEAAIQHLEQGVQQLLEVLKTNSYPDISQLKGAGAAGGLSGGTVAFLGANIQSGMHFMMQLSQLDRALQNADILITGEGAFDQQSLEGKLVGELLKKAKQYNTPTVIFCGSTTLSKNCHQNIAHLANINDIAVSKADAMRSAKKHLAILVKEWIKNY